MIVTWHFSEVSSMSRNVLRGAALWLIWAQTVVGLAETVTLDGQRPGRTFEGLGGLSAGAGTRLLFDYPEPQRSQVLDYLFKPNFCAALQHLKVEIGADINSSEGTEPSHARTRDEFEHPRPQYFHRGYEWWLMREAKKRNPRIYLDVLQWGAPHWIGDKEFPDVGDPNRLKWPERMQQNRQKFYTQDNAEFVAGFIQGAKKYHGLDVDYCGVWNETLHDSAWIKLLRKTLDRRGLAAVEIVGCDETVGAKWGIVEEFPRDAELKKAVSVVGVHYPEHTSPAAAQRCGKPLWSSEDNPGWNSAEWIWGLATAKMFNRNYVQGRMTKTVICYLVDSFYDNLAAANNAPMKANAPWSGHYEVWPALWAIAHTTQFAQPGWRYLDRACGLLPKGGSYVSLRSPESGGDYTIIIETGDAASPQSLSFRTSGGLAAGPLHVWRSSAESQFEQQDDVLPAHCVFTVALRPNCVYSLTTTTGQHKGKTAIPPPTDFPMPYEDDFEGYSPGQMPKYFADQAGVFEVAKRPDGGKCLRQTIAQRGIDWHYYPNPEPYTILGDTKWCNYEVACDAYVEKEGYVALFGRIARAQQTLNPQPPEGYCLKVDTQGRWELKEFDRTLAGGKVAFAADRWHKLTVKFIGRKIVVRIDDTEGQASWATKFSDGMAGVGSGWNNALYDNFSVRPISTLP
jgi:galactosylceramidase